MPSVLSTDDLLAAALAAQAAGLASQAEELLQQAHDAERKTSIAVPQARYWVAGREIVAQGSSDTNAWIAVRMLQGALDLEWLAILLRNEGGQECWIIDTPRRREVLWIVDGSRVIEPDANVVLEAVGGVTAVALAHLLNGYEIQLRA